MVSALSVAVLVHSTVVFWLYHIKYSLILPVLHAYILFVSGYVRHNVFRANIAYLDLVFRQAQDDHISPYILIIYRLQSRVRLALFVI